MRGSTGPCPLASSGPGWPRSHRTTSGSPSFRSGWTPIARLCGHAAQPGSPEMLLMDDVHMIRATNNAIFDDIFWVHLAYVSADDGIERLRALLREEPRYAPVLSGFEVIDRGRRILEDARPPRRLDGRHVISSGRATSSSWNMSSAPWCNPTSIASRAHSPGSSLWARPRDSRCVECGTRSRSSLRSTCPPPREGARTLGVYMRGRGSPSSMIAGVGSSRASSRASGGSIPTHA